MLALALIAAVLVSNLPALTLVGKGESSTQPSGSTLVVMTVNLGNGLANPAELMSLIREHDVDLVALQEVTPEIADALETDLADLLPYQEVRALGIPGKALLSRYPITKVEWLEVNPGRPDLLTTVNFDGQPIEVLVAHPPPPELSGGLVSPREGSNEQFDSLVEIASNTELPFLMMGDFNMISLHERHSELEAIGLQDIFGLVGNGAGFTYPERIPPFPDRFVYPFIRIDYIWASEDWIGLSAEVGADIGSDHRPVIAQIEFSGSSGD